MSGAFKNHSLFPILQARLHLLDQARIDAAEAGRFGDFNRQARLQAECVGHIGASYAITKTIHKDIKQFKSLSSDIGTTCPAGQGRAH